MEAAATATLAWSFEPWAAACLLVAAALYVVGVARLWRHAGVGRGVRPMRALAFALGWITLAVALFSPLDALADALFSAHMVEHETMMIVAAPLFVVSRPLGAWAWALPAGWRRRTGGVFRRRAWRAAWGFLTAPFTAWILHALALWLWHLPGLFAAALEDEGLHAFQHACFLGTALLFWWTVMGPAARRHPGAAIASLFTTMVHTGALGALLTLAAHPWYGAYATSTRAFGLDALQDQQLGGLVMWVPAAAVYLGVGLALASRWLRERPSGARLAALHAPG